MPKKTVYVGRGSEYGNRYIIGETYVTSSGYQYVMTAQKAVELYQSDLYDKPFLKVDAWINRLKGKNLACWCALDEPCHADVLLELANK